MIEVKDAPEYRVVPKNIVTLVDLVQVQRQLQDAMGHPNGHQGEGAKNALTHAFTEVAEALNEVHWKPHKKHKPEHGTLKDRTKFVTELTDVLQCVANAAVAFDVTAEELSQALIIKWGVNFESVDNGEVTRAD
jgi:hypothetical protein